jgi:hypothetical protein
MSQIRTKRFTLAALALLATANCGGNADDGTNKGRGGASNSGGATDGNVPPAEGGWHSTPPATGGDGDGGYPATGGDGDGGYPATGGTAIGGYTATGGKAIGGYPATGGRSEATGGTATGGSEPTGGAYTGGPPNGHTCICALADMLIGATNCTSNSPNDCTLQKAYCGQTCAGQPTTCGTDCIANFPGQGFVDNSTYTSGSCTATIRCP